MLSGRWLALAWATAQTISANARHYSIWFRPRLALAPILSPRCGLRWTSKLLGPARVPGAAGLLAAFGG